MPRPLKAKTLFNPKTRPMVISRKDASRIHFGRRFVERYKTCPTSDELRDIARGVQLGRAHKLTDHAQGKNRYAVAWRGKLIIVVYDFHLQQLITVYPENDPELEPLIKHPGNALKKWLQETKHAAKEAAPDPS